MILFFRRLLVRSGKVLPFVLCFLVGLHYIETTICITTNNYALCNGYTITNASIMRYVANILEYDFLGWLTLSVISISVQTCLTNKLSLLYLLANIGQKEYFANVEIETTTAIIVAVINAIICGYFTYKGITIFLKNAK